MTILKALIGLQYINFDLVVLKQTYINQEFEEMEAGVAPEWVHNLSKNTQAKRK